MSDSRLAIHGAGHLAAALAEGFFRAQMGPISLYNRTRQRAIELARAFPIIKVFDDQAPFDSEKCPLLLVIPGRALLEAADARMERLGESGRVVVSCVNGLPLSVLDRRFPGIRWIKAIPNVAAAVGKSVTLVAKGNAADDADLRSVEQLFETLGTVIATYTDEELDRLSVVTSCLPGILAAMLDEFTHAYDLDESQSRDLLVASAAGSLALAGHYRGSLGDLASSVANPGGLTEAGVATVRSNLPPIMAELRDVLNRKRELRWQQYLATLPPTGAGL